MPPPTGPRTGVVSHHSIHSLIPTSNPGSHSASPDPLANYLACDSDTDSLDIYGLNNYRWCGAGSYESSYASVEASFANYPVVAYFSEYGCVTQPPRLWTEASKTFTRPP